TKLTTLDTSGWGLGNLQNAYAMFNGDQALVMLDTSHWNLSNVTQSHFMFANDVSLTNLDTSQWGLGKDTNTQEMFAGDVALTTLGQTNWDLNQVTDASDMFNNDPLLASLNTKDWAINGPINVTKMFTCDTSLKTLDLSNWDLSSATAITDMLLGTPTLQELKLGSKVAFLTSDQSAVIGDAPLNDTYTGKWINTTGQTFTAAELMQLYNDTSTAVADTYVWQKDQTNVTVRDSVVDQSGQNTWSAADNFDSATDANGLSVTVTDSTVTGQVDTTIPGTYQVTYSILNAAGNVVKAIATVKVVASQVSVAAHDTTVMQGQAWQVADTFDSATDFEGQPVDFSQVVVTGADQVETKTPGTYDVTYRYTDSRGNVATKIIMVTVTPSQVAVTAKNMTVMQGQTWQAADAFVNASDATGQSVALSAVKVTGAVDTQTPGQYQVIYRYTDAYGNQASQVATITVEKSAVAIAANDVTVMQGQPWTSAESFVSATDANGDPVDLSAVTVTGADAVDTKTAGRYPVTYSYMDKYGNQASKVVTVVVKKSAVAIEANGMTIMQNQSWTPADAFVSANDANGQPVAFSQVTVVGANRVAIQTPGSYELTYRYTDAYGNTASKNVVLTVKASQVAVVANDTSLMQGQSWAAADSFVSATDAQGQLVQLNKVVVSGEKQVTTTVPGVYRVTYRNTDIYGNVATKTITVTIKASQVAIDAKNVTLTQGQAWTPADSFVSAHTADGQTLDFKQVSVLGADQVNVKVPGTYAVTYRATDSYGNSVQKTILVTVKASQLGLTVKNMTVKQGTAWTAADALVSATDAAGQAVGLTQLKVIGTVDTSKVGSYPVRYQNTDIYSNQIERTAMITVTPTSLNHSASKPNKSQPIVEPGQAAVVKSAKTPTRSNRSISTRTNAKQNSVETDQAAVIAKVETTKQPTSKLGETHSKAHAKAAKATSLPQTGESSANGAAALGALAISFTGLLSFFNKKRRN
ncbi:bacterial Ig-like domain-containing protein, partial [Lactiplantibacillus xiangfangensis]